MAQNEIQKYYTDTEFYNNIRGPLSNLYATFNRLERMSNFLNSATAADYPNIPTDTLTDLSELRTIINTFLASADTIALKDKMKEFIRI